MGGLYHRATKMNDPDCCFHSSPSFMNSKQVTVITLALPVFKPFASLERAIKMLGLGSARTNALQLVNCVNVLLSLTENAIFIYYLLFQDVSTTCEGRKICARSHTVLSCLASFSTFCWTGWKKNTHSRKASVVRMGRKLHPGKEKALSDVVFAVSCESRKFMIPSKHRLYPPKLSDHIIVDISFVQFFLWSGSSHNACQLSLPSLPPLGSPDFEMWLVLSLQRILAESNNDPKKSENPLRQLTSPVLGFKNLCNLKNKGPCWNLHSGRSSGTYFIAEASGGTGFICG